ncbi:Unconventional myosin-Va [Desmophyllum pertusum]|uniref:Unconventional myosin-Va n=1 Tax=Desmophyllum pertusum TaxID=174260 RepID=A0A9X0A906_9CNID|nr:Unconventional myosin-Va [Desmophyllum pertusum]
MKENYHIFYQLCAACDTPELKDLRLGKSGLSYLPTHTRTNFYYLNRGECPYVDEVDDGEGFEEMREAMDLVGIMEDEQLMIFRILAGILHIGNIDIQPNGDEESEIDDQDFHLAVAADLLGVDRNQFKKWMCNRKIVTVQEANCGREAISKHIYSQLFKWIVQCINNSLTSGVKQCSFLGILDIYGFETFEVNSFEQFCINYANEKLQQQFTQHVFKLEQDEYVKEEIEWSFINFYDNQPCIDLIEAKLGILDLLMKSAR